MAFNWQTFWTRTGTALIFAVVMLAGLLWNQWAFFILFSIIHFGCWYEYQELVGKFESGYAEITPFHRYGIMLAGWSLLMYFTGDQFTSGPFSLHALGWWTGLLFLFALPIIELLFTRDIRLVNIRYSALGIIYISLSWGLLINLRTHAEYGYLLPIGIIFSIWINDTMAYLVGSIIGKTPLSPVSPKKTWEGTIGGILFSIAAMAILAHFTGLPVNHTATIAAIAAITGTFGDLLESKLKRMAGVKDSGHIMPGHGGFLDRFDSLLLATPFVWVYVKLFL
ncbi:phosphatidate cytidylyltransferase [Flavihumibacter profundi]|uniref:phosphatidate cytidylyltransferase n=1 Tax=Flavihumibacter profundi TaxID=2716883 RepID=UPI001CC74362|nr:phosphatidate cytidylyltransferase [Flavihumibacter profundi]MBZ5857890.1 phosphatidate cytidylyltransferase [Flavihumibacter profundi]